MNEDQRSDWIFEGLLPAPNLGSGRLCRVQIVKDIPESKNSIKTFGKDKLSTVPTNDFFLSNIDSLQNQEIETFQEEKRK